MSLPGSRTLWEQGRQPGRELVVLGLALVFTLAAADLLVTGRIGLGFDIAFVLVCLALALLVRPADFFVAGVLPPLLMLADFALLSVTRREAIARADDGAVQALISGLSHHSLALAIGYAGALGILALRRHVITLRAELIRTGKGHRLPV